MKGERAQLNSVFIVDEICFREAAPSGAVGSIHRWLLHGEARRGKNGCDAGLTGLRTCADVDLEPLHLIRSGRCMPSVFSPGVELVVNREVLDQIDSPLRMFVPKRVVVDTLIDFDITKGKGHDIVFASMKEVFEYFRGNYPTMEVANPPEYFELLLPFIDPMQLAKDEPVLRAESVVMVPRQMFDKPRSLVVPKRILNDNLLVNSRDGLIMSSRNFAVLDPHLDRDFYRCKEVQLY